MILPSWSLNTVAGCLKRMLTARLYPGPHDIFVTCLRAPTRASIGARADQLKPMIAVRSLRARGAGW